MRFQRLGLKRKAATGAVRSFDRVDPRPFAGFSLPTMVAFHSQDTPRAGSANSRRLAMTRLARPNRLNNCASFFARPL